MYHARLGCQGDSRTGKCKLRPKKKDSDNNTRKSRPAFLSCTYTLIASDGKSVKLTFVVFVLMGNKDSYQ
jgi:hypothetical protein